MLGWFERNDRFDRQRFMVEEASSHEGLAIGKTVTSIDTNLDTTLRFTEIRRESHLRPNPPTRDNNPLNTNNGAHSPISFNGSALQFLLILGRYVAVVLLSIAGTILFQQWASTSNLAWLSQASLSLAQRAMPISPSTFTVVTHTGAPLAFNYALKQCGAEVIPTLTGVAGRRFVSRISISRISVDATGNSWTATSHLYEQVKTNADHVIDASAFSNRCWEFHGNRGQLGFTLTSMLNVSWVSVAHSSDPANAPRSMVLWGIVDGQGPMDSLSKQDGLLRTLRGHLSDGHPLPFPVHETYIPLARMEYNPHLAATEQSFSVFKEVKDLEFAIGIVVVQVLSNWGSIDTHLCHIGIHGLPIEQNV